MKSKILSLILLISFLLVGCNNITPNSSLVSSSEDKTDVIEVNPLFKGDFSKKDITVQYLYDKYCIFFDDLVFATDNMNHVFRIKDNEIIEHHKFPLVEYNPDNFKKLKGKDILEVVKLVGCPTIVSHEKENELSYLTYDGYCRELYFKKVENNYVVELVYEEERIGGSYLFQNVNKSIKASLKDFLNLKVGMCADDVYRILRGPCNTISNSASRPYRLILDNGCEACLYIYLADGIDCEHYHRDLSVHSNGQYYYLFYAFTVTEDGILYEIKEETKEPLPLEESNDETFMDDSKITIDYLKKNHCVFYENMVFASDKKNHVFFIEDDKIKEHKIYDKINYPKAPRKLFESVKGMKFVDTFNLIGIPSYINERGECELIYSLPYNYLSQIELENIDDELMIKDVRIRRDNIKFLVEKPLLNDNENTKRILTQDDLDCLKSGMCVDDVIRIIGYDKKASYVDPLTYEFVCDFENNKKVAITIELRLIEKECEHARINYDFLDEGNDEFLYGRTIYYYYFKDYRIVEG